MTLQPHNPAFDKLKEICGSSIPNNRQFAKAMGFSEREQNMLEMFWEPTFNGSWIYLSDELIRDYLTNEKDASGNLKKDAVRNFYDRKLIPIYDKDVDYREVSVNHELVQNYIHLSNLTSIEFKHNKRFFIVSGECFKQLILSSTVKNSRETRKFLVKIETLFAEYNAFNKLTTQNNNQDVNNSMYVDGRRISSNGQMTNVEQKIRVNTNEIEPRCKLVTNVPIVKEQTTAHLSTMRSLHHGNTISKTGTYIPPNSATQSAKWSPMYPTSKQMQELSYTDGMEHEKEKSGNDNIRLKQLQDQISSMSTQINEIKVENNQLLTTVNEHKKEIQRITLLHNNNLKRRHYPKFSPTKCFYITSNPLININRYKVGISDDINKRLSCYRTNAPETQINYLIYLQNNSDVERYILFLYENNREQHGHEILQDIELNDIIFNIRNICKIKQYIHTEVSMIELNMYNKLTYDTTLQ